MTAPAVLTPLTAAFPAAPPTVAQYGGTAVTINGLCTTTTDVNGTVWSTFSPIDGWDSSPASSLQLTQKARAAGAWLSTRNVASRPVTLSGTIFAYTPDLLQVAVDQLRAAVAIGDWMLTVTRGTSTRSAICTRQDQVQIQDVTDTQVNWSVVVVAPDPRQYATAGASSTGLPSVTGGVTFPMTFPMSFATSIVSGRVALTNPGNAIGAVQLRVAGPLAQPTVVHIDAAGNTQTISVNLALGASDFLLIDPTLDGQTVLAQGQASRNTALTSRGWHGFTPGVNQWVFSAASGSGVLTVTAVPAWM